MSDEALLGFELHSVERIQSAVASGKTKPFFVLADAGGAVAIWRA